MKKYGCLIIILLCVAIMAFGFFITKPKSFNTVRNETIEYVNNNQEGLQQLVLNIFINNTSEKISYDKIHNISYTPANIRHGDFIQFDYDAQGMLGGQYWGFYYTSDNKPYGEHGEAIELTKAEKAFEWHEPNGNNYYYTEKILDNWYFYYTDYDH